MPEAERHPRIVDPESCLTGCTCGRQHPTPLTTLYSAADAAAVMARDCREAYGDRPVVLLSDPDTHAVAGAELERCLRAEQVSLTTIQLESEPEADDKTVERIRSVSRDQALIMSVGSGTINDLGKYPAALDQIDFWTMPTAPSMNGYTSGIAAIKIKGVKRTLPAAPPSRIYVIPAVIEQAPLKLRQSGFCDVLAKVVSDIDWQGESLLFNGSYCRLPSSMMAQVETLYADHPEQIGDGDSQALAGLFHGLLISGVAMSLAGSSAPASGGEHLLSHFWDMREPISGRVPELHGLQVGLGIIFSSACYRRLAGLAKNQLKAQAAQAYQATESQIAGIWGPYADEVARQLESKRDKLLAFDQLVPRFWDDLRPLFQTVRPPKYFAALFRRVGAPFSLEAFRLSREEFMLAALNARGIRERITVLDFAAQAGVLEAAAEEALALLDSP